MRVPDEVIDVILAEGPKHRVLFVKIPKADGSWGRGRPIRHFNGLDKPLKMRLAKIAQDLCDGKAVSPHLFKHEQQRICAFRLMQSNDRFACFAHFSDWVISYGFKKKGNEWSSSDFKNANNFMESFESGLRTLTGDI